MRDWRHTLRRCLADGPAVLVTVTATEGSTPREVGARMIVTPAKTYGSIGGGRLEFKETAAAQRLLAQRLAHHETHRIVLGPDAGQCCGGVVEVSHVVVRDMVEAERVIAAATGPPARTPLYLYGAGHVARALVRVLEDLPFDIHWVDIAATRFPASIPDGVERVVADDPARIAESAPPHAVHLVMTHDHELDAAICGAVLRREAFAGLGLIGSATKRARFVQRFRRSGIADTALQRLICPIGLPDVPGKTPAAIAIATAAQLLTLTT